MMSGNSAIVALTLWPRRGPVKVTEASRRLRLPLLGEEIGVGDTPFIVSIETTDD